MNKPILCLDFDGVVHSYTSKWVSPIVIPDDPVPGAFSFIQDAMEYFEVHIFSSRSHEPGGVAAMKSWFYHHLANGVANRTDDWLPTWVEKIRFPTVKPPFFVALDDRVLTFKGKWPEISTLREFKPWNKEDAYHKSSGDEWAKTRDALDDHMRMHAPRPLEGKGE